MNSTESTCGIPGEGDDPVMIARYPGAAVARIDALLLINAGVDATVQGELGSDALSVYGTALQQITLVVPSKQRDLAIQILKDVARSRPAGRTEDWVCADCREVSGPEFDSCWSCGKPWNESDLRLAPVLPDLLHQQRNPGLLRVPSLSENPFASPATTSSRVDLHSEEAEEIIRRMWRAIVLSFAFVPLLLVSTLLGARTLVRISNGSLSSTEKQRKKLFMLTLFSCASGLIIMLLILSSISKPAGQKSASISHTTDTP